MVETAVDLFLDPVRDAVQENRASEVRWRRRAVELAPTFLESVAREVEKGCELRR
jgi:hypothetical protein